MKGILVVITLIVIAFDIWVRIAPFSEDRWHVDPETAPESGPDRYKKAVTLKATAPQDALEQVTSIAASWQRTRLAFGSAQSGRISFITRTRIWGFPDVTTVSARAEGEDTILTFFARLRFGGGDAGVNKRRVRAWLAQLQDQSETSK